MTLHDAARAAQSEGAFELDGEHFVVTGLSPGGDDETFSLIKPRVAIEAYARLLERFSKPRMVELGIAYGGSVAFLALAAEPEKFVAIDVSPDPVKIVDDFIERRGLAATVVPVYGVDQADAPRLREIVETEFGSDPLDLVIDDASHQYGPTVASFQVLFPRLRPGGVYVIEDWTTDHGTARLLEQARSNPDSPYHEWATSLMAGHGPPAPGGRRPLGTIAAEHLGAPPWTPGELPRPLSRMGLELVLSAAEARSAIKSVRLTGEWIMVERGDADLSSTTFTLEDTAVDRFNSLTSR